MPRCKRDLCVKQVVEAILKINAIGNTLMNKDITGGEMTTTVTSKGQVTIPKAVRDLLGIQPGSKVDFRRTRDGDVILVAADEKQKPSRFATLRGHAGKGLSTEEIMALTRGDV